MGKRCDLEYDMKVSVMPVIVLETEVKKFITCTKHLKHIQGKTIVSY